MIRISDFSTLFSSNTFHGILGDVLQIVIAISPILLAIVLFALFWPLWINYIRSEFFASLKYAVLEIKLPKELLKSPLAMEVFLNSIHNGSDGKKFAQYWKGEKRPSYSLELVSVEGIVKFFIRTEDRRKAGVISGLYAQFPGIEVHEVEDYTFGIHFDKKESKLWGVDFKFKNKSPYYPIKTYIDYKLDKDPKEEYKIDPLLPMLEFLGSVGPNQQIWIQYIIRAHIAEQRHPDHWFKKYDEWIEGSKKLVNEILMRDPKTKVAGMKDEATGFTKLPTISKGEQEIAEAIERRISKLAFDVGIRAIYIAKKDVFDTPFGIGGVNSSFNQFSSEHLNGFKTTGWISDFNGFPWEDFRGMRRAKKSKLVLEAYKRRSYFYEPFVGKIMVMNTEELATLYHFPGQIAMTPNLNRIPSKKSQAPSNLPI